MIDQSHNLKGKMEAMVQSVVTAQELYAKASLIDQEQAGGVAGCVPAGRSGGVLPDGVLAGCAADGPGVARGAWTPG